MTSRNSPWRARLRTAHRWLAVLAGGYFLLMAVTGVLLNHPGVLVEFDLPRKWVPGDYAYRNGNRNVLRGMVAGARGGRFLYGEAGVWYVASRGAPQFLDEGFPSGAYLRDTRALIRIEGVEPYLLAATRAGLFALRVGVNVGGGWSPVELPVVSGEKPGVVDLLRAGELVLAVTRSRVFSAAPAWPPRFVDVTPPREADAVSRLPLFRLIFNAHSGEIWGLPGQLAVDAAGILLVLFTGTGLWFWWRRRRGTLARGSGGKLCRRGLRWHLRLGTWCALPLLLVALTGLFQRPPFLVAVAPFSYPAWLHPGPRSHNPWHDLLRKAAYDPDRNRLILATADGFFQGFLNDGQPFRRTASAPPVSVMGATVFSRRFGGLFWVGSMSGLYLWDPPSGWTIDVFTGRPPPVRSAGPPVGDHAVTGMLPGAAGEFLVVDYFRGVTDAAGRSVAAPLPAELGETGRISLWHTLFEVHNGRIFGFALGWWSWVVVPLGGLALTAELVSGFWVSRRRRGRAA